MIIGTTIFLNMDITYPLITLIITTPRIRIVLIGIIRMNSLSILPLTGFIHPHTP
jgi:hypothetical protein